MKTQFVLMQRSLNIPEVDKLKRAFRSVRFLTAADAQPLARDAYGILVKNLAIEEAMALQAALQAEGVETAVVMEGDLPPLPVPRLVRRLDCLPEALTVYDPLGRSFQVAWDAVLLIAAGRVQNLDVDEARIAPRPEVALRDLAKLLGSPAQPGPGMALPGRPEGQWMAEIILARLAMRFQVRPDKFNFAYLGERRRSGAAENLATLIRDMAGFAPQAMLNRGAALLRGDASAVFEYPGKNAFWEEILWMLWQAPQAGSGGQAAR